MHVAEMLTTTEHPLLVVGNRLSQHFQPEDAVRIAAAVNADILTIGDAQDILPNGEATNGYLGQLDEHLDVVQAADTYLLVGVGIKAAQNVPWAVFSSDGAMVTTRSYQVFTEACKEIPIDFWISDADADTLQSLAEDTIKVAASSQPATVYSHQDEHPDPPVELFTSDDSPAMVKQCEICHTLTNHKISIGDGFPGPAVEWQCPAVAHRNHDRLETLIERRKQLDRRRSLYAEATETGQRALDRVEDEYDRLTDEIEALREWFDGRFDDVVDTNLDLTGVEQFEEFEPRELQYK